MRGGGQTPPTLDDALSKLNKFDNRYEIGDVLTTSRTNLSDKWLLCNGATLDNGEYPELGAQFSGVEMHFDKVSEYPYTIDSSSHKGIYSMAITHNEDGQDSVMACVVANSAGKIIKKNLTQASDWIDFSSIITTFANSEMYYPSLKTVNNKVFIIPRGNNYAATTLFVMYCNGDPSSPSDFQQLKFPSEISKTTIYDVMYSSGKYFFLTRSRRVLIYDDLSTTPQIITIGSDSDENANVSNRFGVVDGKPSVTYSNGNSDDGFTATFVTIGTDGAITTLPVTKLTTGSTSGTYYGRSIQFVLNSFANKYVVIGNGGNYSGLSIEKLDTLDSYVTDIWVCTQSQYDGFSQYYQYFLLLDNKIIIPPSKYLDSNFSLQSWDSGPNFAGSFEQSNDYYYAMNVTSSAIQIWRSSKSAQFNLPTYSPATGLRAYIKAKD